MLYNNFIYVLFMHLKYNEYTESQISTFPHMHNIKYLMLNKAALLKNTVHTCIYSRNALQPVLMSCIYFKYTFVLMMLQFSTFKIY